MAKELLFEIGTEEIPAGFIPVALDAMKKIMGDLCAQNRIDIGDIIADGTPRRLMVAVRNMSELQKPQTTEKIVPPVSVAFDADGTPSAVGLAELVTDGQYVVTLSPEVTGKLAAGAAKMEVAVVSSVVSIPSFAAFEFVAE